MELVQFNKRIPENVKMDFQLKVLKNKKDFGSEEEVITKLLRYFNKHGLPKIA